MATEAELRALPLRERKRVMTRQAILDAAERLFEERGFEHVTVAQIADAANVSVKTTPDPALGNCVAGAMQHATFAKTQNGGSFGYPFVF